MSEKLITGQGP